MQTLAGCWLVELIENGFRESADVDDVITALHHVVILWSKVRFHPVKISDMLPPPKFRNKRNGKHRYRHVSSSFKLGSVMSHKQPCSAVAEAVMTRVPWTGGLGRCLL